MLKSILAVVAGIVLALIVAFACELAGYALFPSPNVGGIDCSSPETYHVKEMMTACMAVHPMGASLAVAVGWFLGALAGGAAALMIGAKWAPLAWVVAATVFLYCVVTFASFPLPVWMMALSVVATLGGAWGAIKITGATYARPQPHAPKA